MKWLRRLLGWILRTDFNGPARLEVFGHRSYMGWVRSSDERIDVLTINGEALQVDARSRFQLTPLTWQELVDEANEVRRLREHDAGFAQDHIEWWREHAEESDKRIANLKAALTRVLGTPMSDEARKEIVFEALDGDDEMTGNDIPF